MKKTILITGAAGNLGTAVSEHFIKQGWNVIGTLAPIEKATNNQVDFHECDLISESSTESFFRQIKAKYKKLDAVVALVGGFGMNNLSNATDDDMLKMFHLNYMTAFHTAKFASEWMNETGGGHLVFIGAKPALEGGASEVLPYAISKSAVINLAEIINEDDNFKNIQAAVIAPSIIDTPPNRKAMSDANFDDWVKPEAIAKNIYFIVSEEAGVLRDVVFKVYNNA